MNECDCKKPDYPLPSDVWVTRFVIASFLGFYGLGTIGMALWVFRSVQAMF